MSDGERKGAIVAIVVAAAVLVGVGIVVVLNWPEKEEPVKVVAPEAVAPKAVERVEEASAPKAVEAAASEASKVAPEVTKVERAPAPGAPKADTGQIEATKALEYREEFLPSGYSLPTFGSSHTEPNPKWFSEKELDKVNQRLGIKVTNGYLCKFVRNSEPPEIATYLVFTVADQSQAEKLGALASKEGGERIKSNSFMQGTLVVSVHATDKSVADEVVGKLKKAVNFKE